MYSSSIGSVLSDPASYTGVRRERLGGPGSLSIYRFAERLESVHPSSSRYPTASSADLPVIRLPDLRPTLLRHAEHVCREALSQLTAQLADVPPGTMGNWGFDGGGPLLVTLFQIEAYVQEQDRLRLRICCERPLQPHVDEVKARWARQLVEQGSEASSPPALAAMRKDLVVLLQRIFKNERWGELADFTGRDGMGGARGLAREAQAVLSADPSLDLGTAKMVYLFGPMWLEERKQTGLTRGVLNSAIGDGAKVETLIDLMKGALVTYKVPG